MPVLATGNRCGHNRRAPRWRASHPAHRQPPVLHRARDNCRFFVEERHRFPELRQQLRLEIFRQYERRSERLEAIALVVSAMLWWLDIASFRVGKPSRWNRRRVDGLSTYTIAEWTGLKLRRVDRAIRDLHLAGYLHCDRGKRGGARQPKLGYVLRSPQPVEQYGNRLYRGLAAVRCFTPRFFERLGVLDWLRREQQQRTQAAAAMTAGVTDLQAHRAQQERAKVKTVVYALAACKTTDPPPD